MPDHRGRCRQGREVLRWSERRDLLPGEVRMSNTHVGAHPIIPRMIRMFSVPILLFWLALTVIVNVVVPQLKSSASVLLIVDDGNNGRLGWQRVPLLPPLELRGPEDVGIRSRRCERH